MGEDAGKNMKTIREAQRKASERKEWKGRVSFVQTTAFARPKEESPNVGHGHHWFGNAGKLLSDRGCLGGGDGPLVEEKEIGSAPALGDDLRDFFVEPVLLSGFGQPLFLGGYEIPALGEELVEFLL